ncbi:MAG: zinc ribbon domain-containing protein [Alphaproteobacteria bacterium]|nr:zinc ribbon domain-containing protein [Alphaproteobacteria bacterium]
MAGKCPDCGGSVAKTDKFCGHCGAPVRAPRAPSKAPASVLPPAARPTLSGFALFRAVVEGVVWFLAAYGVLAVIDYVLRYRGYYGLQDLIWLRVLISIAVGVIAFVWKQGSLRTDRPT